jgi:hypothetical protein
MKIQTHTQIVTHKDEESITDLNRKMEEHFNSNNIS